MNGLKKLVKIVKESGQENQETTNNDTASTDSPPSTKKRSKSADMPVHFITPASSDEIPVSHLSHSTHFQTNITISPEKSDGGPRGDTEDSGAKSILNSRSNPKKASKLLFALDDGESPKVEGSVRKLKRQPTKASLNDEAQERVKKHAMDVLRRANSDGNTGGVLKRSLSLENVNNRDMSKSGGPESSKHKIIRKLDKVEGKAMSGDNLNSLITRPPAKLGEEKNDPTGTDENTKSAYRRAHYKKNRDEDAIHNLPRFKPQEDRPKTAIIPQSKIANLQQAIEQELSNTQVVESNPKAIKRSISSEVVTSPKSPEGSSLSLVPPKSALRSNGLRDTKKAESCAFALSPEEDARMKELDSRERPRLVRKGTKAQLKEEDKERVAAHLESVLKRENEKSPITMEEKRMHRRTVNDPRGMDKHNSGIKRSGSASSLFEDSPTVTKPTSPLRSSNIPKSPFAKSQINPPNSSKIQPAQTLNPGPSSPNQPNKRDSIPGKSNLLSPLSRKRTNNNDSPTTSPNQPKRKTSPRVPLKNDKEREKDKEEEKEKEPTHIPTRKSEVLSLNLSDTIFRRNSHVKRSHDLHDGPKTARTDRDERKDELRKTSTVHTHRTSKTPEYPTRRGMVSSGTVPSNNPTKNFDHESIKDKEKFLSTLDSLPMRPEIKQAFMKTAEKMNGHDKGEGEKTRARAESKPPEVDRKKPVETDIVSTRIQNFRQSGGGDVNKRKLRVTAPRPPKRVDEPEVVYVPPQIYDDIKVRRSMSHENIQVDEVVPKEKSASVKPERKEKLRKYRGSSLRPKPNIAEQEPPPPDIRFNEVDSPKYIPAPPQLDNDATHGHETLHYESRSSQRLKFPLNFNNLLESTLDSRDKKSARASVEIGKLSKRKSQIRSPRGKQNEEKEEKNEKTERTERTEKNEKLEKSDKKGKKVKSPRGSATRQKSLPIEKKLGSPSKQNSKAVKEKMSPKNLFSPRRSSTQKKIHSMDFQDSPVHLYKNNLAVPEDGITHHRSSSHVEMIVDLPPRERKRSTTNSSIPVHLEED